MLSCSVIPIRCGRCLRHRNFSATFRANREKLGLQVTSRVRLSNSPKVRNVELEFQENKPITYAVREAMMRRDLASALDAFNSAKQKSTILYAAMIHAALVCGATQKAADLYTELRESGLTVTIPVLVSALDIYSQMKQPDVVGQIWVEMKSKGIPRDHMEVAYAAIINAKAVEGDVEGAKHLISELAESGIAKPGVVHFGALLKACSTAADSATAKKCLVAMQKRGIDSNVVIYTNCIRAMRHATISEIEDAMSGIYHHEIAIDSHFLEVYVQTVLGKRPRNIRVQDLQEAEKNRIQAAFKMLEHGEEQVKLSSVTRKLKDMLKCQ